MNEIQLSQDINVITAEINSYKQVAGQAIFEIGKRLKHVKENDLVHGEFGKWLESVGLDIREAQRFMKVAEELPNTDTWSQLSNRALYLVATLPQEEREKEHVTSKGETKTVDEMTVRELQEVKRRNKELEGSKQQAEKQAEQARQSEEIALKQLEELESKEPETIEKEVIPEHVKTKLFESDKKILETTEELRDTKMKLERLKNQVSYDSESDKKEKELKALQYNADKTVLTTKLRMDEFLKDVAVTSFRKGAIASSSEATQSNLKQGVEELEDFCKEMRIALSGRIDLSKQGVN